VTELRKERAERAPGGVTPGDDMYYAAAARAKETTSGPSTYSSNDMAGGPQDVLGLGNLRSMSQPQPQMQQPMQQQQQPLHQQQYSQQRGPPPGSSYVTSRSRHPGNPGGVAGGAGLVQYDWEGAAAAGEVDAEEEEELELEHEHGELMESILEDEEEIIALHRQQIEDAMEVVRRYGLNILWQRQRGASVGTWPLWLAWKGSYHSCYRALQVACLHGLGLDNHPQPKRQRLFLHGGRSSLHHGLTAHKLGACPGAPC